MWKQHVKNSCEFSTHFPWNLGGSVTHSWKYTLLEVHTFLGSQGARMLSAAHNTTVWLLLLFDNDSLRQNRDTNSNMENKKLSLWVFSQISLRSTISLECTLFRRLCSRWCHYRWMAQSYQKQVLYVLITRWSDDLDSSNQRGRFAINWNFRIVQENLQPPIKTGPVFKTGL